jgi:hypothetical protein
MFEGNADGAMVQMADMSTLSPIKRTGVFFGAEYGKKGAIASMGLEAGKNIKAV